MFNWWKNWPVGMRILSTTLIITILGVISGSIGVFSVAQVDSQNKAALSAEHIESEVFAVEEARQLFYDGFEEADHVTATIAGLRQAITDYDTRDGQQLTILAEMFSQIDAYEKEFTITVKSGQAKAAVLAQWRAIGEQFNANVAAIKNLTARGNDIYLQADKLETQYVLMRVSALYFILNETDQSWLDFVKATSLAKAEATKLSEMTAGIPALAVGVSGVNGNLTDYGAQSEIYHQNVLDEQAAIENAEKSVIALLGNAESGSPEYGGVAALGAIAMEQADSSRNMFNYFQFGLIAVNVLGGLMLAFILMGSIKKPLAKVMQAGESLAVGDVNHAMVDVDLKDEIGKVANAMRAVGEYMKEMATTATEISKGNAAVKVVPRSKDDILGNAFVEVTGAVQNLISDAGMLSDAAVAGRLNTRADAGKHHGDFRKIVEGVNNTLDAVIKPVNEAAEVLDSLAQNDLTARVTGDYHGDHANIKNSLNSAMDNISALVNQLKDNAEQLSESSEQLNRAAEQAGQATQQIASTSQQVARGAGEQSESLQQTTQSVEQLSKAIEQIAQGAQEQAKSIEKNLVTVKKVATSADKAVSSAASAAGGAKDAASSAKAGADMAHQTVDGMNRIKESIGVASKKISDLGERSNEIGKIVATIDDISAQTNLLALNAAIEAARAGEQGRGFAVVADEVRKLAERSLSATQEIADLIGGIQTGVEETIKAMGEGNKEIESGYQLAVNAGSALEDILKRAEEVGRQVDQIAVVGAEVAEYSKEMVRLNEEFSSIVEENTAATEQMAASSDQVSKAVESVAGVSEENSAATEQVSASAQEMSAQVEQVIASSKQLSDMSVDLMDVVAQFKLEGSRTTSKGSGNGNGHGNGHGNGNGNSARHGVREFTDSHRN
jgi:methyl-accepting chemotaxis protein